MSRLMGVRVGPRGTGLLQGLVTREVVQGSTVSILRFLLSFEQEALRLCVVVGLVMIRRVDSSASAG